MPSSDLVFSSDERLSLVFDVDTVFLFVVVFERREVVTYPDIVHRLELNIQNAIESAFAIVCHDDRVDESLLHLVSFLLLIDIFVLFVDVIDLIENSLTSDYLTGRIDPQKHPSITLHKVRSETFKHFETIDRFSIHSREIFACTSDLDVTQSTHDATKGVVEEK